MKINFTDLPDMSDPDRQAFFKDLIDSYLDMYRNFLDDRLVIGDSDGVNLMNGRIKGFVECLSMLRLVDSDDRIAFLADLDDYLKNGH